MAACSICNDPVLIAALKVALGLSNYVPGFSLYASGQLTLTLVGADPAEPNPTVNWVVYNSGPIYNMYINSVGPIAWLVPGTMAVSIAGIPALASLFPGETSSQGTTSFFNVAGLAPWIFLSEGSLGILSIEVNATATTITGTSTINLSWLKE